MASGLAVTTSETKCVDLVPIKVEGKTRCGNYLGKNLCSLKSHFICEPSLQNDSLNLIPVSYSQISTFGNCPRKYFYQYILRIRPLKVPPYYVQGRVFHAQLADYYRTGKMREQIAVNDENEAMGYAHADAYIEYYHDHRPGLLIETEHKGELDGKIPFVAILDLYDKAEGEIQDHKLSRSVSSFLITAFQAYMYFEAQRDAKKFTLNVTLKSGLKRKGAENLMDYYYRLRKDLTIKAGKTFRRITYHRSEIMDYYKREVNNIIAEINRRRTHSDDLGLFYMNPSACSMIECEYQPICENLALPKGLYKIEGANNDKKQRGEQCAR